MLNTWYDSLSDEFSNKLKGLKLLVCDVDGVFSDGRIYLGNDGEELKAFHTKDGFGVKALIKSGVEVAIITGRQSNIVQKRMQALGVNHIIQGCEDKLPAMQALATKLKLDMSQLAYVGDDMGDAECIEAVAVGIGVNDAHPGVLAIANWRTTLPGGFGAVREITDSIMQAQGTLAEARESSV